ncbi:hypothetical protein LX36DRAFT_218738 [Colletotrichum falcatum]|nr:hypothetical protein LX36DRAFT_218738 [Colletotrichum falcatum]
MAKPSARFEATPLEGGPRVTRRDPRLKDQEPWSLMTITFDTRHNKQASICRPRLGPSPRQKFPPKRLPLSRSRALGHLPPARPRRQVHVDGSVAGRKKKNPTWAPALDSSSIFSMRYRSRRVTHNSVPTASARQTPSSHARCPPSNSSPYFSAPPPGLPRHDKVPSTRRSKPPPVKP